MESSNIKAVGYDPTKKVLEVEFKNGRVYQYEDVPSTVSDAFVRSESLGRFFSQNISGRFKTTAVAA